MLKRLILQFILTNHITITRLNQKNQQKSTLITFFWQGRPSHRNVVLPNYFLFDKFPGIVQNGKNFIIVVTSKTIYGISTILVLKF